MNTNLQIVLNGMYISELESYNCSTNRAFLYGDAVFETLRVNNRNILYFEAHINRLVSGMTVLHYNIPEKFTVFKTQLKEEIIGLLNRNKIFKSSRIRLTVYRKSGGYYTPETNDVNYLITAAKLDSEKFILNSEGLRISIFSEIKKPLNIFSPFKTANSLIYTLAGVYKNKNHVDECLILNEKNQIIESIASNLFIVKNKTIITPPVSDGCINGIMRNQITKSAKLHEIPLIEQTLNEDDILQAEELFLTNSIRGVQWVVAYKNKRYYKRLSEFFTKQLNTSSD